MDAIRESGWSARSRSSRIISDNRSEFPPYQAEARDIRIIGQVIW